MNKLIVEYYGNRMKPEEDCYDIFCVDENGNKNYVCGGFNKDQVNVATFAINCYMTIESTKGISFKVDDEVKVRGDSGTWFDGKIMEVKDFGFGVIDYKILVENQDDKQIVNLNDVTRIKLKEKVE